MARRLTPRRGGHQQHLSSSPIPRTAKTALLLLSITLATTVVASQATSDDVKLSHGGQSQLANKPASLGHSHNDVSPTTASQALQSNKHAAYGWPAVIDAMVPEDNSINQNVPALSKMPSILPVSDRNVRISNANDRGAGRADILLAPLASIVADSLSSESDLKVGEKIAAPVVDGMQSPQRQAAKTDQKQEEEEQQEAEEKRYRQGRRRRPPSRVSDRLPREPTQEDDNSQMGNSQNRRRGRSSTLTRDMEMAVAPRPGSPAATDLELTVETDKSSFKCRVEKDTYLDWDSFLLHSHAHCYNNIPDDSLVGRFRLSTKSEYFLEKDGELISPLDYKRLNSTFRSPIIFMKWLRCCEGAKLCCGQNQRFLPQPNDEGQLIDNPEVCPATWDRLACWPDTKPGEFARQDCVDYFYLLEYEPSCKGQALKLCYPNGTWFTREGHEWTNYRTCINESVFANRLGVGALWHILSALVIGPAIMVLKKIPNRGNSKRVKIISNLLFWLLVNNLLSAVQKIGIVSRFFEADSNPNDTLQKICIFDPTFRTSDQPSDLSANMTESAQGRGRRDTGGPGLDGPRRLHHERFLRAKLYYDDLNDYKRHAIENHPSTISDTAKTREDVDSGHQSYSNIFLASTRKEATKLFNMQNISPHLKNRKREHKYTRDTSSSASQSKVSSASRAVSDVDPLSDEDDEYVSLRRNKRETRQRLRRKERSPFAVTICWLLAVSIRITRLLGYAWMFTGGIYLCSVLLFAPADPPATFTKVLLFGTNAVPIIIGLSYVVARTCLDQSPLKLLFQLPYYYFMGDERCVEYLWASQLQCWLQPSKIEYIEAIADFPVLVFIVLNAVMFFVTLIIMCRISGPGSTRPEMSLLDYSKAVGTLCFLYGFHYTLFAYRPEFDNCVASQVLYYACLLVDGAQGIVVAGVFCYKSQEGKDTIKRWWSGNRYRHYIYRSIGQESSLPNVRFRANNCPSRSSRSNLSSCNGTGVPSSLDVHDVL